MAFEKIGASIFAVLPANCEINVSVFTTSIEKYIAIQRIGEKDCVLFETAIANRLCGSLSERKNASYWGKVMIGDNIEGSIEAKFSLRFEEDQLHIHRDVEEIPWLTLNIAIITTLERNMGRAFIRANKQD